MGTEPCWVNGRRRMVTPGSVLNSEAAIRLGFFAGVLVLTAVGELLAPRRRLSVNKPLRWFSNLGLVALNTLAARFLVPLGVVGVALVAEERGWGLFHNVGLPAWLAVALAVVALDLVIYLQHVMFHAVPVLWRLHMVHHADLDFDVTTGRALPHRRDPAVDGHQVRRSWPARRAGPGGAGLRGAAERHVDVQPRQRPAARLAGPRAAAGGGHAGHAPGPPLGDCRARRTATSASTCPWWDFLFGTYRAQPAAGHEGMTIGLEQFRDERVERLHWMLALPFIGPVGSYPINQVGRMTAPTRVPSSQTEL